MTYFAPSWPLDPCLDPERGDDCCINRPVCQLALSLRTGVGVGVWLRMTTPSQLWTSQLWQGQACASGHPQAFFSPKPVTLALFGVIKNYRHHPSPRFKPWQQLHNSFLFWDYQNTNRNCVWLNFLLCFLGDWGWRKLPGALYWR